MHLKLSKTTMLMFGLVWAVLCALIFAQPVFAAPVTVNCSGSSGLPTAVDEASLAGDDVTFSDTGGDGYCELDAIISATSVVIETGVILTHPAQAADGVNITTTGNFTLQSGAFINTDAKGCPYTQSPNGSNVCADNGSGAGEGEGRDGAYNNGSGGAGHGGGGGRGEGGRVGGAVYGSSTAPVLFGSGGGWTTAYNSFGGSGGGFVRLNIGGDAIFSGIISANGGDAPNSTHGSHVGGGGSGGSVYLTVSGDISGSGSFAAAGGNGLDAANEDGGGGGGGRVAISYATDTMSLDSTDFDVSGGTTGASAAESGEKGTVYAYNSSTDAVTIYHGFTYDDTDHSVTTWTMDNSVSNQSCTSAALSPSISASSLTFAGALNCTIAVSSFNLSASTAFALADASSITVASSGSTIDFTIPDGNTQTWTNVSITGAPEGFFTIDDRVGINLTGNSTINANVEWLNLTGLNITSTASISANNLGCPSSESPDGSNVCADNGIGAGTGEGKDAPANAGGGGGGYGGIGGNGEASTAGGNTYGSVTAPTQFGSGGGKDADGNLGGPGGGYIHLDIDGNFAHNGLLSADGGDAPACGGNSRACGGGSGGAIYVSVSGTISGSTGSFSADGGAGESDTFGDGGGGGGGRVAVRYGTDTTSYLSSLAAATVAAGGLGVNTATSGADGTLSKTQIVLLNSVVISDNNGYTNDSTPLITLSENGATPTQVSFSCNGGANWSSWIAYPDDNVLNDVDGPTANIINGVTGCSGVEELKTISVRIQDASSISSTVSDTTTYDVTGPTVDSVSSPDANGTYGVDDVITVAVQWNEAVGIAGTPQIQLDMDGTDRQANYSVGTGTDSTSFTYTIVTGDNRTDLDYVGTNSLTLNSGTITDLAGNAATLTLATPGAAGSLGANKDITISTNQSPTVSTVIATQSANGDGDVTITFVMNDPDDDNTLQAKIEYSTDNGGSWFDPTLSTTDSETTASVAGDPSVDNAQTYQVGQSGAYILSSSGANTVSIVWEAATDLASSTDLSTAKIRATPYDGIVAGSASSSSTFTLDFVDPASFTSTDYGLITSTSLQVLWGISSDTNFSHYELWYGTNQGDVDARTGTASEWDDSDDANLATGSTSSTVITGFSPSNYFIKVFAVDDYGNAYSADSYQVLLGSSTTASDDNSTGGSGIPLILVPVSVDVATEQDPTDSSEEVVDFWGVQNYVLPDHWSQPYVKHLQDNTRVIEVTQQVDSFVEIVDSIHNKPDMGMTRAQSTELLLVLAGYPVESIDFLADADSFTDISGGADTDGFIQFAMMENLVDGHPDGSFKPEFVVNRVEALKMAAYFFGTEVHDDLFGEDLLSAYGLSENPFVDVDLDAWYAPYVLQAYAAAVVHGYEGGEFKPGADISYAEFLKIATLYQNIDNADQLAVDLSWE